VREGQTSDQQHRRSEGTGKKANNETIEERRQAEHREIKWNIIEGIVKGEGERQGEP
jgi:hypothetical protein